jgi:regulator of protease activity HflC (stomatin/prohibitin superfamily)
MFGLCEPFIFGSQMNLATCNH